jgi:MerR family transcriptional regulator/heat shock protein HspR
MSDTPRFTVTEAARLAGMHPQTLRQYDRLGLVVPKRAAGRGRRYSRVDVERLLEVQRLAQVDGVNLAGIRRILALEQQVAVLEERLAELFARSTAEDRARRRVFTAGSAGEVVVVQRGRRLREPHRVESRVVESRVVEVPPAVLGGAVVLWRPGAH